MPGFHYTALAPDGSTIEGVLEAPDRDSVVRKITRDGHYVIRIRDESSEATGTPSFLVTMLGFSLRRKPGLKPSEVMEFTRELALMLRAAHDLDRALRYITDTTERPEARRIVTTIRDSIREGGSLGSALSQHPESFPRLYIGLVRAGEAGGSLGEVLGDLAAYLERRQKQASEIRSAMIYPALLAFASLAAVIFLLTMILPQFETLFTENGATLPILTRFVIALGHGCSQYGPFLLMGVVALYGAWLAAMRTAGFRHRIDRLRLNIPLLGPLAKDIIAARITRTLGTLTANGVALVPALQITLGVIDNTEARAALDTALRSTREGGSLGRALAATHVFPRRMTDLLQLGEETAQFSDLALKAAEIHETQSKLLIDRMVALLVPAITILMGGVVATIVTALLMAMLSLNDLAS